METSKVTVDNTFSFEFEDQITIKQEPIDTETVEKCQGDTNCNLSVENSKLKNEVDTLAKKFNDGLWLFDFH